MPDPIVIVPYDPEWVHTYAQLRDRAASALVGLNSRIEHIGSTSVPGLAAKPIIDLVAVVAPPDVQTAIGRLVAISYSHQGSLGVEGRDAFGAPPSDPVHHLYLCPTDSEELRAQLAFRDRLRTDPALAACYADLKHELAAQFRDDREGYTDAKTDFVLEASRATHTPLAQPSARSRRRRVGQRGLVPRTGGGDHTSTGS